MSDSFRNGTFALGLTLGILLTTLACFYIPIFSDEYDNSSRQTNYSQIENSEQSSASGGRGSDKRFNPWEEGYAQWIMAIFTAVMAILAWAALHYIKKTADFTNKTLDQASKTTKAANATVEVSQKVGTQQVRAFIFIKEVIAGIEVRKYTGGKPDRYFLNINLMMDNGGQSPATKVHRLVTLKKDPPEKEGLVDLVAIEHKMNRDIPVGSPFSFYKREIEIGKRDFTRFCRKEYTFVLSGAATYDILFGGNTGKTPFEFHLIFNKLNAGRIQVKNRTQREYS